MSNTENINSRVKTISTEELAAKLNAGEPFEFWNVLTAEYYSGRNIKGSRHVPLDTIGRELAALKPAKDAEIIVYCAGPECPQSGAAAEKLLNWDFANAKAYEGGLEEWEAAGLPIVKDEAKAEKAASATDSAAHSCH